MILKEKLKIALPIGFVAFVLLILMAIQFKTVSETNINAIETMRETELRTELATWKTKYEDLTTKLDDTEKKISEYKEKLSNDQTASELLNSEVKEAESYLGYTDLQGPGVIITLSDGDQGNIIYYSDIIRLINELNIAGAEAISINDERIVSTSSIATVNNRILLVNEKKMSGPYTIKAIGDKQYIESSLTIKGGYIETIKADYKDISYEKSDNIVIPAYSGKINYDYANKLKKEDKQE